MGNCVSNQEDIRNTNKVAPISLLIKHFTWNRESHGLFDYENRNVQKGQFKTSNQAMKLIRIQESIKLIQTKEELTQIMNQTDRQDLLKIYRQFSKYQVESSQHFSQEEDQEGLSDNCPWIVVKSCKSQITGCQGYDLKDGDYVKLGRVRFRIREMKFTQINNDLSVQPELERFISQRFISTMDLINHTNNNDVDQIEEPQCRICYNDQQTTENNPLVDCCKCQGSVRYIHIQCLQTWLVNKLNPKTTRFSVSFTWKQFDCEVCKAIIPNRIRYQNKIFETIIIPKPEVPYITLEILSRERNQSKGTHIISLAQKQQIKLGRGHDSDVRITDISVSRCHAIIKYINSSFIIEDQQSKFGTLVLLRDPLIINLENNNIGIQVGRSVISLQAFKDQSTINMDTMNELEENELIGKGIGDEDQNLDEQQQDEQQQDEQQNFEQQ